MSLHDNFISSWHNGSMPMWFENLNPEAIPCFKFHASGGGQWSSIAAAGMSAYFGSGQQIELALKLRNRRAFRLDVGARVSPAPNLISHWSLKTKRLLEVDESYKIDVQSLKVRLDLNKSLPLTPIQTLNFEIETEHQSIFPNWTRSITWVWI